MITNPPEQMIQSVKQYYGEVLKSKNDLKTSACCVSQETPEEFKKWDRLIHEDIKNTYYGCGVIAPNALKGLRVLDLGSGSGYDCYILSGLVGPEGQVIGVDMTDVQVQRSKKYIQYHTDEFGYNKPNVEFHHGYIEDLTLLGLESNYFDLVISNCVINLSPFKEQVLKEVFRVLKPGGEFYFSDIYSDRRINENLKKDPLLYGECLSGALYLQDFFRLSKISGFIDPRQVTSRPLVLNDQKIIDKTGSINFFSKTFRLFKIETLEEKCEDFGQAVVYLGNMDSNPHHFSLDDHHLFQKGKIVPVCGNTFDILHDSRFHSHFDFIGDKSIHFGLFEDCGPSKNENNVNSQSLSFCC